MLGEGTKTAQTKSDKFEVKIQNNLGKFLAAQPEPYRSLDVSRYEGSDTKFYSDIKVTNPKNEKSVWIEVKLNKYANLGGPSFKYKDGKWTCTTTKEEEDHLTQIYLEALESGSERFISFCRKYLKTDDINIPKDLTPELIEAWKRSGSVEDTENDVQFITDKVPLEGFGEKIAEYYKTAKYEPVYYMQVDDELYIIDPEYNPLGLKTKDGQSLKTLAEAYRIGRIQFRAKGIDKKLKDGDKYYYSIVCDVKILADDEKGDEPEYVCSFKSEDKFPSIEGQTVSESYEPPYTMDQIRQKYGEDTYRRLSTDPVHKWRADSGIELVHREPTKDEFERIWKNWQLMPDEMKSISDKKSLEFFGVGNKENYERLLRCYGPDGSSNRVVQESGRFARNSVRLLMEQWIPDYDDRPVNQWGERWMALPHDDFIYATVDEMVADCQADPTETHREDSIKLNSVHRTEHDVYIATMFGGCNCGGTSRKLVTYLAVVKKLVKRLLDRFGDVWLVDWDNDCADDVWTVRLAFRNTKDQAENDELGEIYDRLMELYEDEGPEEFFDVQYKVKIPREDVKKALDSVDQSSNPRYNRGNFEKYIDSDQGEFEGLFSVDKCLALAVVYHHFPERGYHFVMEIQSFGRGFGKRLLRSIVANNGKVWLYADPTQGGTLVKYYRQPEFDFDEFVVEKSIWGTPLHVFFTKDCNKETIERYVTDSYVQKGEMEDMLPMGSEAKDVTEPVEEGKFDFRLPDEAHARPGQRFAFQNRHDSYGGDDYLNVAEIGGKLQAREHNKYSWFAAGDAPDRDKCRVFIEVDDGKDSRYAVVGNKCDRLYNRFLVCAVAAKDENRALPVGRFVNSMFAATRLSYMSQARQHMFVFMNPGDEMVYVCNGMRLDGMDVILEMEPSTDYAYEPKLANMELVEAEKDIGGEKSDDIPESGIKIWIDDIREAPPGFKWFKSVNKFIDWCYSRGGIDDVTLIDTDHDAGDFQVDGGDYVRCFDYLDANGCENVTVHIHSANPVGANNIRRIITRNKERGWKEIRNS